MGAQNSAFDPVAYVAQAIEELNHSAAFAVDAARAGRAQDILRAVAAMQALMIERETILREVAAMLDNPRTDAARKAAIRDAVVPGIETFNRHLSRIENISRAWQDRADVLRRALQAATTTHSVYTGSRAGVRLYQQTVRHAVTLTA